MKVVFGFVKQCFYSYVGSKGRVLLMFVTMTMIMFDISSSSLAVEYFYGYLLVPETLALINSLLLYLI